MVGRLSSAEVEQLIRGRVLGRDGQPRLPDDLVVVGWHRSAGMEARPEPSSDTDELRPHGIEVAPRPRAQRLDGQVAREGVAQLGREELRAETSLADRRRTDDLLEVLPKGVHGLDDLAAHRLEPFEDGDRVRPGLAASLVDGLVDERR